MATATRTGIAKAATASAELTDIDVLEVANVDAPANKRPFVVVKSADTPAADSSSSNPADPAPGVVAAPVAPEQQVAVVAALAADPAPEPVTAQPSDPIVTHGEATPVEKRGAKMAKKRLERLEASYVELGKILKELRDEEDAEDESAKSDVAKASEPNPLAPRLEALTKSAADLQAKVVEQENRIAEQDRAIAKQASIIALAKRAPAPNSNSQEGSDIEKAVKPFAWPY
jgi:hypothetical protein